MKNCPNCDLLPDKSPEEFGIKLAHELADLIGIDPTDSTGKEG